MIVGTAADSRNAPISLSESKLWHQTTPGPAERPSQSATGSAPAPHAVVVVVPPCTDEIGGAQGLVWPNPDPGRKAPASPIDAFRTKSRLFIALVSLMPEIAAITNWRLLLEHYQHSSRWDVPYQRRKGLWLNPTTAFDRSRRRSVTRLTHLEARQPVRLGTRLCARYASPTELCIEPRSTGRSPEPLARLSGGVSRRLIWEPSAGSSSRRPRRLDSLPAFAQHRVLATVIGATGFVVTRPADRKCEWAQD